jgi:predicted nucleotidyltransferase
MNKAEIVKSLHDNLDTMRKFGVSSIGLFGSYSSYQNNESSDIDILVHFEKEMNNFNNFMDLKFFLENIFKKHKVDLVIDDSVKPALKESILGSVEYAS